MTRSATVFTSNKKGSLAKMHVAIVTHKVDAQDGQGRVNYEIARGLLERGHQVTIVGTQCSTQISSHPKAQFIRIGIKHLRTQFIKDLYFAWKSSSWIRRHRKDFDIIQANGFVMWEPADVVAVHFVHSCWLKNFYYPYKWLSLSPMSWYQRFYTTMNAFFEKKAFKSARELVVVSPFTGSELIGLGVAADRIHVVYNGVDVEEFHPGLGERADFGIPEGVPVGLFVGDIKTPRKNLETVLKAMEFIPAFHLVVAGSAEGSPYPKLAEDLKLRDRVHFLGKTSKIPQLMRSVDMFVFPSRYEAHPLVLMEAMASGIPVIVSGNFRAADYIGAGGQIFDDPNDVAALTKAINGLVDDPELRKSMGDTARKVALSMQWAQTAEGYLNVYERLILDRSNSNK